MRKIKLTLIVLVAICVFTSIPSTVQVQASSPTTSNLNGLTILSTSNGWAVGDGGMILHFDGSSWSIVPSATSIDLLSVSFGPLNAPISNAGFAVGGNGANGIALYRSDVTWASAMAGLTSPPAQRLASVFEISPTDAWAVDSQTGAFWHWSGTFGLGGGWTLISSAVVGMNSIWMVSPTEGWAVGVGGVVYHYGGGGWTIYATLGTTLNSLFMLSSTEGWAVGNQGSIYHYSSGIWSGPVSPSATSQNLRSIFMISQSEGWAVGASGTIVHLSGGAWTALPPNLLATNQNLNAVYFSGQTGWAVGDHGTIITIGGQLIQGVPSTTLQSVYLSSASDGWISSCSTGGCGSAAGDPVMVHWDGTSFTRGTVSGPAGDLYSVYMTGPAEGWAVGGAGTTSMMLHYTGGSWIQSSTPAPAAILRSVFMIDSNNGWAVGSMGVILHYSSGTWGSVSTPTTRSLRSIYMLGSMDGWAVGDSGEILRYSNGPWVRVFSPTSAQLNSVFMFDSTHGWAAGSGGTLLHYDGNFWLPVATSVSTDLNSIVQVSSQEAWAVGNSATILHWTGVSWNLVALSPSLAGTPNLNSLFMTSPSFGLIVGAPLSAGGQGMVLRIPQLAVVPEFDVVQMLLPAVLTATLITISRRRSRVAVDSSG